MKPVLVLCTLVLGASMFAAGQTSPSAPPGSTPPTFPSDQSRPAAPDTSAPAPQQTPDIANPAGSSTTQSSTQDSTAAATQEKTIEGCLAQASSGGAFTLTDSSGANFILQGDTSKLAKHVGEEVQVNGTATQSSTSSATSGVSSSSGSASDTSSQPSTSASSASSIINVKSVHKVASSCSAQQPAK